MSRVNQIQQNYQPVSNQTAMKNYASKQIFRGGLDSLPKDTQKILLNGVEAKIDKRIGKSGKFLKWIADTKGEIQTQSITAVFTTTLAPLMIVANPFTKNKTKEDKEYLALRQPLSAAVSLSGGLAMTLAINHFMETMYNEGHVGSIDLRLEPSKDYSKRYFKKAYKEAKKNGKANEFLAKYDGDVKADIKANAYKNGHPSKKYVKECFKTGYLKKMKDQRIDLFTQILSEKPENVKMDSSKNIVIGGKNLQENHLAKVKNLDSPDALIEYLNKNSFHRRNFGDFMAERFKFEFYGAKDGALKGNLKEEMAETKLSKVKATDFLIQTGLMEEDKIDKNELIKTLSIFQQERNKSPMEKQGKLASRITEMKVGEEIGKADSISLGQFFHQLGIKQSNGELQKLMKMKTADALLLLNGKLKGKLKGYDDKADLKSIAKNQLKNTAKRVASYSDKHKFFIGIFFNLFTTAVTCTILNWAYPRFVEAFFPNLVKNKKAAKQPQAPKQEGGNK